MNNNIVPLLTKMTPMMTNANLATEDFNVDGTSIFLKLSLNIDIDLQQQQHRHHDASDGAIDGVLDVIASRNTEEEEERRNLTHYANDENMINIENHASFEKGYTITQHSKNTDESRKIEVDDGVEIREEAQQELAQDAENDDVTQEEDEANADDDELDLIVGEVSEDEVEDLGDEGNQDMMDATNIVAAEKDELENEDLEQQYQQNQETDEQELPHQNEQDATDESKDQHNANDVHPQEGESQESEPSLVEPEPEPDTSIENLEVDNNNQPTKTNWDPYHILHPKKNDGNNYPPIGSSSSSSSSHSIGAVVSLSFLAATSFFICICCLRYYSRRRNPHGYHQHNRYSSNANNKHYSALHGSDDFFDGTFSDDVSYFEKDSDDDEEYDNDDYDPFPMNYSHDSDDDDHNDSSPNNGGGGGGLRLEMRGRKSNGAMHESLTLDECNG